MHAFSVNFYHSHLITSLLGNIFHFLYILPSFTAHEYDLEQIIAKERKDLQEIDIMSYICTKPNLISKALSSSGLATKLCIDLLRFQLHFPSLYMLNTAGGATHMLASWLLVFASRMLKHENVLPGIFLCIYTIQPVCRILSLFEYSCINCELDVVSSFKNTRVGILIPKKAQKQPQINLDLLYSAYDVL